VLIQLTQRNKRKAEG